MARNQKLTHLLQGRSFLGARREGQNLIFDLSDGSTMWVKTATGEATVPEVRTCGAIHAIRQQDTSLALDFESGASLSLETFEATSCVLVRDKNHVLEYVD